MTRPRKPKREYGPADRLGREKDGLRWKWRWPPWHQCGTDPILHGGPGFQVASAEHTIRIAGDEYTVKLRTVRWEGVAGQDPYYQAEVSFRGAHLIEVNELPTRLDAQRKAESLFAEIGAVFTSLQNDLEARA